MESKFFKATPGWGTSDIDSVINEWLHDKKIKVIDIKHSSHIEKEEDYYGRIKEVTVYTAILMYEYLPD